jgi:formate hydrogenlyase subunit 3/multisubunit Na+/H+ antiporter MnhD subunit
MLESAHMLGTTLGGGLVGEGLSGWLVLAAIGVPLLPLLAAVVIGVGALAGWPRGDAGEPVVARVAVGAMAGALLLLGVLQLYALVSGEPPGHVTLTPWLGRAWIDEGRYHVPLSLTLDRLGLAMATLAALCTLLTTRFSVAYLHREAGFARFFAILSLFNGGVLLVLLSGNAVLAFCGWELVGLTSYLLIGYATERPTATANAARVFVTNRFGDAGFIMGIMSAMVWLHSVEWPTILAVTPQLDPLPVRLLAGGFLLAALVKSAQFPFAAWLGRALEGPTPSSAIFYGALMVHVGLFLMLRLEPLLLQTPMLLGLLFLAGLGTVIYGVIVGFVQTDVKSALIFSTQTQVGVLFMACGLGAFDLAAWHLALHTVWRTYQFLNAPSYMHQVPFPPPPAWGWLRSRRWLFTAALQRFWLDPVADAWITRPTRLLAQDLQSFDDRLVNRLLGFSSISTVLPASHERGVLGRLLERVANWCHWFESRFVLSSGDGILHLFRALSGSLLLIDRLLGEPRYLVLMIVLTFLVILV